MGLMRFILALSVILWHSRSEYMLLHGGLAVIIFYCISGFYMAMILNEKYLVLPKNGMKLFYLNRVLRLYPIYLLWLLLLSCWTLLTHQENVFAPSLAMSFISKVTLIFSNLTFVGLEFFKGVLAHEAARGQDHLVAVIKNVMGPNAFSQDYIVIGPAWSVSVEILFYAIAPFIVVSLRRVGIFLALALGIRLWFIAESGMFPNDPWRYRFMPGVLVFFLLGACGYYLYRYIRTKPVLSKAGVPLLAALILVTAINMLVNKGLFINPSLSDSKSDYDSVLYWVFYLSCAVSIPFIFNSTKSWKFDAFIGKFSYPMYIVHYGIINNVMRYSGLEEGLLFTLTAIFSTLFVSLLFIILVDNPIEGYKRRIIKET